MESTETPLYTFDLSKRKHDNRWVVWQYRSLNVDGDSLHRWVPLKVFGSRKSAEDYLSKQKARVAA